jgi:hypothetical protein
VFVTVSYKQPSLIFTDTDGRKDRRTDKHMNGGTEGRTSNRKMHGQIDRWKDKE